MKETSVLLHICCGICALASIDQLKNEGYQVAGFFYNPNIHPEKEYQRRLQAAKEVAKVTQIKIIEGDYNPNLWKDACSNLPNEPEGKKRCQLCYELRLKETFKVCQEREFDYFTTTLTISPHKNSSIISAIGSKISKEKYLLCDFKKNDGFKKTIELTKKHNLYRQSYCGCIYSINER